MTPAQKEDRIQVEHVIAEAITQAAMAGIIVEREGALTGVATIEIQKHAITMACINSRSF